MAHICTTYDGVPIVVGLRVVDYDALTGTVVEAPKAYELAHDPDGCHSGPGHNGHWWMVKRDDGSVKEFDGSRLTTRGAK